MVGVLVVCIRVPQRLSGLIYPWRAFYNIPFPSKTCCSEMPHPVHGSICEEEADSEGQLESLYGADAKGEGDSLPKNVKMCSPFLQAPFKMLIR